MKADATKDGIRPKRGMYIVSDSRRRAYGPIVYVRQDILVWQSSATGYRAETDHSTIHRGDYRYAGAVPTGYELHDTFRALDAFAREAG